MALEVWLDSNHCNIASVYSRALHPGEALVKGRRKRIRTRAAIGCANVRGIQPTRSAAAQYVATPTQWILELARHSVSPPVSVWDVSPGMLVELQSRYCVYAPIRYVQSHYVCGNEVD